MKRRTRNETKSSLEGRDGACSCVGSSSGQGSLHLIEGVQFTSRMVAVGLGRDAASVEACCDRLARRQWMLREEGVQEFPDGSFSRAISSRIRSTASALPFVQPRCPSEASPMARRRAREIARGGMADLRNRQDASPTIASLKARQIQEECRRRGLRRA
jgi:hypothetical protein